MATRASGFADIIGAESAVECLVCHEEISRGAIGAHRRRCGLVVVQKGDRKMKAKAKRARKEVRKVKRGVGNGGTPSKAEEAVPYRHFERGDSIRVGGLVGRYRFVKAYVDNSGTLVVDIVGASAGADNSRCINPKLREIVDADAGFTWRIREGVSDNSDGPKTSRGDHKRMSSDDRMKGYTEVKATAEENEAFEKKHGRKPDAPRVTCDKCHKRVWATPVGASTHKRNCPGKPAAKVAPKPDAKPKAGTNGSKPKAAAKGAPKKAAAPKAAPKKGSHELQVVAGGSSPRRDG